jgi:NADPH-dependent curcumin reductase CurA
MKLPSNSPQKKLIYTSNNWSICRDGRSIPPSEGSANAISPQSTRSSNSILVYEAYWEKIMPDLISREIEPSVYLGALSITGLTAWAGLNLVDAKAGDIIFISGAAGAVGNVAGQLAKLRGCQVIGSADSPEQVEFLLKDCGFDVAFDDKHDPFIPKISLMIASSLRIAERLHLAALNGIDVYFDNVGGEILEAALLALRVNGRIIACGGGYNMAMPQPEPSNLFDLTTKRLTMKGLIASDRLGHRAEFEREVGGYFQAGKLKNQQTVIVGIDRAVSAFLALFTGENISKMVVKLE